MSHPLVTVVTPSFNQGRFIRQTIESVLAQDYPHVEYIIMDGGSTDETAAIAREYASRLQFVSERDRGQSHAINKGFRAARGEIVSWINSDDLLLPGAITHAVRAFERCPGARAVYGEGYLIDREGNRKGRFPATEPFNLWKLIYASDYVLQQTVYFRRSVFDEVGYLDEQLHWGMDWDILIRIAKLYGLEYIPEYMGCLREYDEAKTFSGGARRFRELAVIMRRHGASRYPPGYVTYGLDTWQNLACGVVERWTPGFLRAPSRFATRAMAHAAHLVIARVLRNCQGLYSDGWAGPKLHYMVPPSLAPIRLHGRLPAMEALRGQVLTVRCDGEVVKTEALPFGEFALAWKRPDCADASGPAIVEITASRFVIPKREGMGEDSRNLSFLLTGVHAASSEEVRSAPAGVAH